MEEVKEVKEVVVAGGNGHSDGEIEIRKTCRGLNTRGEPCQSWVMKGSEYCWTHAPETAEAAKAARAKGGANNRAKHNPVVNPGHIPTNIRDVEGILQLLDYTLAESLMLSNSLNRTRAMVKIAEVYSMILDKSEVNDRIELIEADIGAIRKLAKSSTRW